MHSVTPTFPESIRFYSAWKGKEFCYCLFLISAPPNGELYRSCTYSMCEQSVKTVGVYTDYTDQTPTKYFGWEKCLSSTPLENEKKKYQMCTKKKVQVFNV